MPANRKNTRLPPARYRGRQSYFLTSCTDRRFPHLAPQTTAENVQRILMECALKHSFLLHAFCLMPDHVHILAAGTSSTSDAREFIHLFKQRTAFEFRRTNNGRLWEKSYYDYILRPGDSIESIACYIWWNPVRKNLCPDPAHFAFSGSHTIDWIRCCANGNLGSAPWKSRAPA
jgi:REP-associated tyrosine transposase